MNRLRASVTRALALATLLALPGCASTQVLRDFTSDGCSLFPDGDGEDAQRWAACCLTHDQSYWRGGTAPERRQADAELRACVLERTGRTCLASAMYRGVRIGGSPWWPTGFRWGYGWGYGRGYEPLDSQEQQLARERLEAVRARGTATPPP